MSLTKNILFIHSGARHSASVTREILPKLESKLASKYAINVRYRDLEETELPLIDHQLLNAFFTKPEELTEAQKELLSVSEQLIDELKWADEIVIGAPIYNFSVTARLKAWIDLVCRAGLTFRYTENGPEGLLDINRAYLVVASGGTPIGSEIDFASGYLKQIAHFIGIKTVELIRADGSKHKRNDIIDHANLQLDELLAA